MSLGRKEYWKPTAVIPKRTQKYSLTYRIHDYMTVLLSKENFHKAVASLLFNVFHYALYLETWDKLKNSRCSR